MSGNGDERPEGGRRRPLLVLAVVTAVLGVASFFLNRHLGDGEPARPAAARSDITVLMTPYDCVGVATVPLPGGRPGPGGPSPRVYCTAGLPRGENVPREPVTPAARAAAARQAAAVSAVLDTLARDCATGERDDPGCPRVATATVHVTLAPGNPVPPAIPLPQRPSATDASARLARRALAAAGYRTAVVRVAMPYDPAPAGTLIWALDTGDACAIGYRYRLDPEAGSSHRVLGKLDSGACLR